MAADRRDSDPKPLIPELKVSEAAKRTSPMQPMGGMPAGPPAPPPPAAAIFGQPAIHGMTGPQQQQQLIFMQQQIRAQQLAALQVIVYILSFSCLFTYSTVYLLFSGKSAHGSTFINASPAYGSTSRSTNARLTPTPHATLRSSTSTSRPSWPTPWFHASSWQCWRWSFSIFFARSVSPSAGR